ncbi:MAG: hydroxyethylthiazole kinase [Verrucomicrobia bacterium]|nr:hydroxyethylthiazole kinase [Verrucomicrobiota bacterium]
MAADIEVSAYSIWTDLQKIRSAHPLIHNMTNSVVQDFTANALLALGASPIMSDSSEETEELVAAANAVNINIGTPTPHSIEAMLKAIRIARELGKPVVLDPVAVGATKLRRTVIEDLLRCGTPTVVRGNLAEISIFAGMEWGGKGVDSGDDLKDPGEIAGKAARRIGCTVVGSGRIDYASDGERLFSIANGHPMMTRITGMGCVATSMVAAFLAVQPIPLVAAVHAMTLIGIAGEWAAERARAEGSGTFRVKFLDSFDHLVIKDLASANARQISRP